MTKIFLVEDNPDHALLISKGLSATDCEIVHYPDGKAFLDFFSKDHPENEIPLLIVLDLKLPGMDGFEILRRLRSLPKYRLIPVVILTTSKYQQEINRAYELGANGFVTKPAEFSDLLAKLTQVKDYWLRTVEKPRIVQ
jgi:two-component system, response regulator